MSASASTTEISQTLKNVSMDNTSTLPGSGLLDEAHTVITRNISEETLILLGGNNFPGKNPSDFHKKTHFVRRPTLRDILTSSTVQYPYINHGKSQISYQMYVKSD